MPDPSQSEIRHLGEKLLDDLQRLFEVGGSGYHDNRTPVQASEIKFSAYLRGGIWYPLRSWLNSYRFSAVTRIALIALVMRDSGEAEILRVTDGVVKRMIGKWLNAGVMEDGRRSNSDRGTPQGGVISPLLANIYLHEVHGERMNRR